MSIQTGKHQEMYNTNMSVSTAKDIFAKIWDKPVCDLFVESDMPGFSGVCTVQESSGSCSWCSGKSARPGIVDEQIVAQTAQWFSGLMQVIESTPFSYLELIANARMEIFFILLSHLQSDFVVSLIPAVPANIMTESSCCFWKQD
jgi:hypothetical protein